MAKAKIEVRRTKIGCPYFCGFLDEMPQDAKDAMMIGNLKLYERIFGKVII